MAMAGGQGVGFFPEEFGGGEHEHGPEAFAAGLHGITHGFVDATRAGRAGGSHGRQEMVDAAFDAGDEGV
jgi:hypothetical protein